jgi:hypothetical protein
VTGICGTNSGVYGIGKYLMDRQFLLFEYFYPLPLPMYPPDQPSCDWYDCLQYIDTRDIAYEQTSNSREPIIWVALGGTGGKGNVIKAYMPKWQNGLEVQTSRIARQIDSISSGIGIGNDLWGLAFEKGTGRYLWVNNQTTGKIYKIDLDMATPNISNTNTQYGDNSNIDTKITLNSVLIYIPVNRQYNVVIIDTKGRSIMEFTGAGKKWHTIPKQHITRGTYIIKIQTGNILKSHKLLIAD